MIFYFSGTGNSLYAAKKIGQHNNETVINIATVMNSENGCFEYTLEDNEVIGFVYPVFAWAAPKMVFDFIEKLTLNNYNSNFIFAVATYGQNIGEFNRKSFEQALQQKGLKLNSGFSIQMPNNYIKIANKEKQEEVLKSAEKVISRINDVVENQMDNIFEIAKVPMSETMEKYHPTFNENLINTDDFYATNSCTSCGLCEKVCNGQTIKVDGKPVWGNNCTKCFACIHLCPVRAVQLRKQTEKEGRYKNPNITIKEMKIF